MYLLAFLSLQPHSTVIFFTKIAGKGKKLKYSTESKCDNFWQLFKSQKVEITYYTVSALLKIVKLILKVSQERLYA